jgi:hypothetical protein
MSAAAISCRRVRLYRPRSRIQRSPFIQKAAGYHDGKSVPPEFVDGALEVADGIGNALLVERRDRINILHVRQVVVFDQLPECHGGHPTRYAKLRQFFQVSIAQIVNAATDGETGIGYSRMIPAAATPGESRCKAPPRGSPEGGK